MSELAFPVYINTRGRPTRQMTAKALLKIGVTPTLVVEDAEHDAYAAANPACPIVVWPAHYLDDYEKTPEMDPHPTTGVGRNYAWDHSREAGHAWHWIMDDNIRRFTVLDHGRLKAVVSQTPLWWHETFAQRWRNLGGICLVITPFMARPVTNRLVLNTRLYCSMLINNEMADDGIRWRRGYNEDTITSLDILKTGYWCTAQSYVVGIEKIETSRTGRLAGGMTQFYANGGFVRKANELVRCHPDVATVTVRFQRIHHHVDYKRFTQRLIRADTIPQAVATPV